MAKFFFSMSGEGRGHATRVRAVIEQLRHAHEITVLAPGHAYKFLSPLYADTDVRVLPIPGLLFQYNDAKKLDARRTVGAALQYLRGFGQLRREVEALLKQERPDLVVADFEPSLPRAAKRLGIPFVSLTHQHFLLTYNLSSLPFYLRAHASYMRGVVGAYYSGQKHTIVSSFYFPPLRAGLRNVTQVGVMLRPEIRFATPTDDGYIVAYLRQFAGKNVLDGLMAIGRPVRVYGLGERPVQGNLTFHAISEEKFIADLISCSALVATSGNQLVGEALFLGKPCFVMPEARNYEQYMNAHFLQQSGAGAWAELEKVRPEELRNFVERLDQYAVRVDRKRLDGLPATVQVLERMLPQPRRATTRRLAPVGA